MNRRCRGLFLLAAILMFPVSVHANMGTPLMWAEGLHLVFGNALIGLLEGWLLGWIFRVRVGRAVGVMILANYASAWVGSWLLHSAWFEALPVDLNNARRWFWGLFVIAFLFTLLVEWPFVRWACRGAERPGTRSVRGSLVIQSVSYLVLAVWYGLASNLSLFTDTRVVAPAELTLPAAVRVYYIGADDGEVHARSLSGGAERMIFAAGATRLSDTLFARVDPQRADGGTLVVRLDGGHGQDSQFLEVLANLPVAAIPTTDDEQQRRTREDPGLLFGRPPYLGSARESPWEIWAGFWTVEGLRARNRTTGQEVRLAWDSPFGGWIVRSAVLLPSDIVLLQLGPDQICAFDLETRRIALLWRGRSPVPVLESPAGEPTRPEN